MNERQELKRKRTKEAIVEAAHELIQENGFSKLSLRAIARRIQYAPASLYEYFDNKDAIIDALCEYINHKLAQKMQEQKDLVEMAWVYIQFALEKPDDFQLLYHRPLLPDQEEQIYWVLLERASEIYPNQSQEEREILIYGLWSMAHGMALLALNRELHDSLADKEIHCRTLATVLQNRE